MLQGMRWWNWMVNAMTGGGRCLRRRKSMAGGRGTAEAKKIGSNCNSYISKCEITGKPYHSPVITKLPPHSIVELDLYTQARKALSFRSPFDSEDSQAHPPLVSSSNSLPSGVSHFLSRQSDSRKRQKKLHSTSKNKSSAPGKSRGSSFWIETEEYFRELAVEDVERLYSVSRVEFSSDKRCFLIPSLNTEESLCYRYDMINRMQARTCEREILKLENGVELNANGKLEEEENGPCSMDVDGGEVETRVLETNEESIGEKRQNDKKVYTSFSGVEWILGSRSKIYLTSERPSKKRKLLGRDPGLQKILVACPAEGLEPVCHYCSYGNMGDPLNILIKCWSCGMDVHQRCYGVQGDVDSSWMCSWCKWKNVINLNTDTPCLLCPKQGGALKPVRKRSDNEESKMEFAHLFCCQWMPEVYVDNTRTMEPIMKMDELKDARRKLICYLCKVKYGACVRCSNGSCRTSFHPICAREARHRMEIRGKIGSDEVELSAFCSKHSDIKYNTGYQETVDISLAADLYLQKLNDIVLNGEDLQENRNCEFHPENGDALHPAALCSADRNNKYVDACGALKFTMILKKLVDLGKVNAKDLASEIGVSADSLNTILNDNHMVPELQCKLLKWLKTHAHVSNLQKTLKLIVTSLLSPKSVADVAEGVGAVPVEDSSISDDVRVKSVPPRRRTKSSVRRMMDDKSCLSKDNTDDETTEGNTNVFLVLGEDSHDPPGESLSDQTMESLIDPEHHQENLANNSIIIEEKLRTLVHCLSEDDLVGETKHSQPIGTCSLVFTNGEINHASYIHPFIYCKLMQTENHMLDKTASCQSAVLRDGEASQLEASSSSGLCCNNHGLQATSSSGHTSVCNGVGLDQLVKAKNMGILKLSPADEVEGELIYYQQRLLHNAVARKSISGDLISKVVRSLPQEIDAAGKRKWDGVLVSNYIHELREAKKQGRKERRRKEAQSVLAVATAAAAASSRISSIRKDSLEESSLHENHVKTNVSDVKPGFYSKLNPRAKETISRSAVARSSFDISSDSVQLTPDFSKEHPRTCDICRRSETALNPILVCSSCKIAVHLDCYRGVKSATGPWHCELCADYFSSRGSATSSWEKPYFVAECGLCGGTAGAFRKSVGGQWIHALCAEWMLESTYRRGQINPIEGMDSVSKGVDTCTVCCRKQGICLKCSYGHCQTTFHPTCARSAGFYMTVRNNGGKLQHKAYCEKHSVDQRAKADTQRHGMEEFKSLKQVRVELERLRLLCERIIKREKLKRELVLYSHDILASSRDSVLSALARHPFYQPEVSSDSATSIKGSTDGYKSSSEMVHRSEDISVDSTVARKRRVKRPTSVDNDQKTDDSSTSQSVHYLKPAERVSYSGKQIPQRVSVASRNLSDDVEKRTKYRKHSETFEKELVMTSDQASMKNQRLPKGFVYVPIRCLSKDKETVPDACSREPVERNG